MKISAEMPHIIWDFLPLYSPDYNLIELVWYSAKEYIAHRLFESAKSKMLYYLALIFIYPLSKLLPIIRRVFR